MEMWQWISILLKEGAPLIYSTIVVLRSSLVQANDGSFVQYSVYPHIIIYVYVHNDRLNIIHSIDMQIYYKIYINTQVYPRTWFVYGRCMYLCMYVCFAKKKLYDGNNYS